MSLFSQLSRVVKSFISQHCPQISQHNPDKLNNNSGCQSKYITHEDYGNSLTLIPDMHPS